MPNDFASRRTPAFRTRGLRALALCCAMAFWPTFGEGAEKGPFKPFVGSWRGGGKVVSTDGRSEPISCRSTGTGSNGATELSQSLVCASDSYRFNIVFTATVSAGNLQGHWQETTRNVEGDASGQLDRGDFEGTVTGPGFNAQISLRSNGRKQVVEIRPSGGAGGISLVQASLSR